MIVILINNHSQGVSEKCCIIKCPSPRRFGGPWWNMLRWSSCPKLWRCPVFLNEERTRALGQCMPVIPTVDGSEIRRSPSWYGKNIPLFSWFYNVLLHPRWCRISSINSMQDLGSFAIFNPAGSAIIGLHQGSTSCATWQNWLTSDLDLIERLGVELRYIEIADNTFAHLHGLSLDWHLRKKMGSHRHDCLRRVRGMYEKVVIYTTS